MVHLISVVLAFLFLCLPGSPNSSSSIGSAKGKSNILNIFRNKVKLDKHWMAIMQFVTNRQSKNLPRKSSLQLKYHHQLVLYQKEQVSPTYMAFPEFVLVV